MPLPREVIASSKPLPSMAEINAYLERSAAMTKKRLPLAFNAPKTPESPAAPITEVTPIEPAPAAAAPQPSVSRALPLVGQGKAKS